MENQSALRIQTGTYAEILKGGGVVAFPTETVYGLGASATNPGAIKRVFELKGRPADNPLIVHISNYGMLLQFAAEIPKESRILMQKFWPGPLTLVFEKRPQVLDMISAGLSSVAVRMPNHTMALALIDAAGPLVAPSANKSGRPSPTRVSHVQDDFASQVPVLDGGECEVGLESTVLDVRTTPFRILRPGYVTAGMIRERTGLQVVDHSESESDTLTPVSPGMKYTHYAPDTPVRWMTEGEQQGHDLSHDRLYLYIMKPDTVPDRAHIVTFDGNLDRMARELYDWFRRSDLTEYSEVVVQPFGVEIISEFAKALNNRISKAIKK